MKKKSNFKFVFAIYVSVLAILCVAALIAMKFFLSQYEKCQPDKIAADEMKDIVNMAQNGTIGQYFIIPDVETGPFEADKSVKEEYYRMLASGKTTCEADEKETDDSGNYKSITYAIKYENVRLGKIKVNMANKRTHLLFFDFYDCAIESVTPVVKSTGYDITIPSDFTAKVNGIEVSDDFLVKPAEGEAQDDSLKHYRVDGLYLDPTFALYAPGGQLADHVISKNTVTPVLILPKALTVTVDGKADEGTVLSGGTVFHPVSLSSGQKIEISDDFGNRMEYDGKSKVPLTYKVVYAPGEYTVSVNGSAIPKDKAILKESETPPQIAEYCSLPDRLEYRITVLKKNAEIVITDASGKKIEADTASDVIDLSPVPETLSEIPDDIAAEINVLEVAEMYSRFLTQDLEGYAYGFYTLAEHLVEGSELYNNALAWANGVDITFTSIHVLDDPPFTEESVTNFVMLSDNCFCCDVHFVKQMILDNGTRQPDPMNSTFYFVKEEGFNGPAWKLIYMNALVKEADN